MDAAIIIPPVPREATAAERSVQSGPRLSSALAVATIHAALLAALAFLFHAKHLPPPPSDIVIPMLFVPADPARADPFRPVLAARTLPAPTAPAPVTLGQLPPVTFLPSAQPSIRRHAPAAVTPAERTVLRLPPPPASAELAGHAMTAAPDTQRAMAEWEAGVHQAVQEAALYPIAARRLHRDGRAQVRFDYDKGAVEQASIAQTSHFGALDTAALAAVTRAAIPQPPAALGPQKRTMLVWIEFKLQAAD